MTTDDRIAPQIAAPTLRARAGLWLALLALVAVVILSFGIGKYPVSPGDFVAAVLARITGQPQAVDPTLQTVLWQVRLPRVLAGLAVGAALAAAGATYQGLFRNPLVSPDILGVSSGASLGAVLGIFLSLPVVAIQLMAFAGGLMAVALVYAVGASIQTRDPVLVLVLAGVAVGALLAACVSLLKVLADPYNQLPAITYWLLGSLAAVTRDDLLSVMPALLIGFVPLILLRWRMNLMSLGDEEARALGIDTTRLRCVFIAAATLITAAAVAIAGVIGWIGLLIPHIARMLVGPDFGRLLLASIMLGGGYLVGVDALARSIAMTETPLGILTAALGAPFFLYLLATTRRGWQ
ncbi:iron ABC transporter permease [Vineibacter terrae]|uniref:Iron ABC transporter permease n=1 Tax=Vineibacter terrae TaxID=2586908 RepID=A0A5C8PIY1_9HYPH|nr:iron ABC transporter permease [Vineibacter terrae]TXL73313.1 iron ABC transporter permease [Vineibacter terrae]